MVNNDVNALRTEARRAHRAVTRKVSRLNRVHDVELSGTSFDPRRDLGKVKRYNSTQLQAYIRQLRGFTSRSVQFVGDAKRKPIPASSWQTYKSLEAQYNAKVASEFSRVASIVVPQTGMTIGQRMAATTPLHPQMTNPAVNAPYAPPSRRPRNVASAKALDELTKAMRERLKPEYNERLINEGRKQFGKMAAVINEPELAQAVNNLSNEQFSVLWNYTGFANSAGTFYDIKMLELSKKEQPWHADPMRAAIRNAYALAEWAKTIGMDS